MRFLMLALVTLGVTAGAFVIETFRARAVARAVRINESRELDEQFNRESIGVGERLREFQTHVISTIPFAATGGVKRWVLDETGLVLAHTSPAEVGRRKPALLERIRRDTERDPYGTHRLASRSWEGFPSSLRYSRMRGSELFFGMEKTHAPVKAATSPAVLLIFIAGGLLGLFFAALAFIGTARPPEAVAAPPNPPPFPLVSELGKFLKAREDGREEYARSLARRGNFPFDAFEKAARDAADLERIEAKFVDLVAAGANAPVLYFRYDHRQGIAQLAAKSGSAFAGADRGAGGTAFALPSALVSAILTESARGRRKSLSAYAALGRMLRTAFGVSVFEAWPMTGFRGSVGEPSRLLGVIVIAGSPRESARYSPRQNPQT